MDGGLKKFHLVRFELNLLAKDTLLLPPYKGSTFRGGFGHAFKRVACVLKDKECSECLLRSKCIYSYVFETPPPEDTHILRKYPTAPHPFIIEPPLDTRRLYEPGEELKFGLVLIGRAIDYLPYFIYTFEELGRIGIGKGRGKYELREVRVEGRTRGGEGREGRTGEVIYRGDTKTLSSKYRLITGHDLLVKEDSRIPHLGSRIILLFLTPTRLKYEESLTSELEFHILLRNLLRRISLLSYFHCGKRLEIDFRGMIEKARKIRTRDRELKWVDWERYSARQETRLKMGGFVGSITFEGELEEFLPVLRLGELVHVGKGTSFGLGQYRIESVEAL